MGVALPPFGEGKERQKKQAHNENGINGVQHTVDDDGSRLPRLPRFLTALLFH